MSMNEGISFEYILLILNVRPRMPSPTSGALEHTECASVEQRLHRARRLAQPVGALHVAQRDRS